jgi:hypothetical protein
MTDKHPFLRHLSDRLNVTDPDALDDAALATFVRYSPHDRQSILDQTEAAIGEESGSMRQRAGLHQFSRKLRQAHTALRWAKK